MKTIYILIMILSIISLITSIICYEYVLSVRERIDAKYYKFFEETPKEKAFWNWLKSQNSTCKNCSMIIEAYI